MRSIHYSITHIKDIIGDKSRMDAYAFALQIKILFTSSTLKGSNTTIKHLKKLFKMGDIKLKRCLSDAEKYGYIRREGNLIIANRLYSEFDVVDTLIINENTVIPHNNIVKTFRRSIFLNKIKIVQHAFDTETNNARVRIGRRKIASVRHHTNGGLTVCGSDVNYAGFNFGYDGIAQMMGVSTRTAKREVKDLYNTGVIRKRLRFVEYIDAKNTAELSKSNYATLKEEAMLKGKYLYKYDGIIWERQTNSYALVNPKNIKIYKSPSKRSLGRGGSSSGVSLPVGVVAGNV